MEHTGLIEIPTHTGLIEIPTVMHSPVTSLPGLEAQAEQFSGGGMNYYTLGQVGQEEKEKTEVEETGEKPAENGIMKAKILGIPAVFLVGAAGLWLLMKK
jgi:hypothetical protein